MILRGYRPNKGFGRCESASTASGNATPSEHTARSLSYRIDGMVKRHTIAVLGGSGSEGSGLALRWAKAGYTVIVGSRNADKARAAAAELNQLLGTASLQGADNRAAAQQADVVV